MSHPAVWTVVGLKAANCLARELNLWNKSLKMDRFLLNSGFFTLLFHIFDHAFYKSATSLYALKMLCFFFISECRNNDFFLFSDTVIYSGIVNFHSCCRTAVVVGQRALSLSAHMAGTPPPTSGPGEGDVTTPAHRSIAGTTGTSLLRGTGGF